MSRPVIPSNVRSAAWARQADRVRFIVQAENPSAFQLMQTKIGSGRISIMKCCRGEPHRTIASRNGPFHRSTGRALTGPAVYLLNGSAGFAVALNSRRPRETRDLTAAMDAPRISAVSLRERSSMSRSRIVRRIVGLKRLIAVAKCSIRSRRQQDSSGLGLWSMNVSETGLTSSPELSGMTSRALRLRRSNMNA